MRAFVLTLLLTGAGAVAAHPGIAGLAVLFAASALWRRTHGQRCNCDPCRWARYLSSRERR